MCVCVRVCVCVCVSPLTDNHCQDDQDDDDENDPQFHILPPQLALQTSRSPLEHVSILVQIVCEGEIGRGRKREVIRTHTHTHTHTHTVGPLFRTPEMRTPL